MLVFSDSFDEFADRFDPAFQGRGPPALEKSLRRPGNLVVPEAVEFVLQNPSPVDPAIAFSQGV